MSGGATNRYSYLNAKLRSRIGNMISEETFTSLRRSKTLSGALILLKGTPYAHISGDIQDIESDLVTLETRDMAGIKDSLKGYLREAADALFLQHETECVKRCLRPVFSRQVLHIEPEYLPASGLTALFPHLNLETLTKSLNLTAAGQVLSGSAYGQIISDTENLVLEGGSIFPLEIELDRRYYGNLVETMERFPGEDRKIAERMTGIEIDIRNIGWICRTAGSYSLPQDRIMELLFPGGLKTEKRSLREIWSAGTPLESLTAYLGHLYPGFDVLLSGGKSSAPARLAMFDTVLETVLEREIRHVLLGNPFTIGILFAYSVLRRRETRRLISSLNAAAYGLEADEAAGVS